MEGLEVTPSFWRERRVLVTGHTGFKGAWLSLWLAELGARVLGYALPPATTPDLFAQLGIDRRIRSVIADIRDGKRLLAAGRELEPEIVLHLAAQSLVRSSYDAPIETFDVNVMGTAHVLEAARQLPSVKAVVIVTTDKCYENREWDWGYREVDAIGGHDPYSTSKACAELVTASYRKSFLAKSSVGVASARAGNVIGGGDWAKDRIIPDLVRGATVGEPVVVRNPQSTRPWQHALDVLRGYLVLAERLYSEPARYSEAWNFGPTPDDVRSVSELATLMCEHWGTGAAWRHEPTIQQHEARSLTLDSTKARTVLHWKPRLSFEQSVRWTVDWYRTHRDRGDLIATTLDQIGRFQELVP